MKYEAGLVYHVYNRGINSNKIFYEDKNYIFFREKMKKHLLPCADILCYCLMPNHFHIQLVPNANGCKAGTAMKASSNGKEAMQKLSQAIRLIIGGYSRAINRQEDRTGSLFQQGTKAKIGWGADLQHDKLLYDLNKPYTVQVGYIVRCFRYIHNNPVKAKIVSAAHLWPHSSALDYLGERDLKICNYPLTNELLGIRRLSGLEEYQRINKLL